MAQIILDEGAAPSTPAANKVAVYAKADGLPYTKDDAGVESAMSNIDHTGHIVTTGAAAVLGSFTYAQLNTAISDADVALLAGSASQVFSVAAATAPEHAVRLEQLNLAPLSFRNKILNGDMRIDQRNAGAAVTPTASTYLVDRFQTVITQASKLTFQQVADAPAGFKYSTKITVASQFAPGASDIFAYLHRIEGQNVINLAFGTASASAITVSFYAKASVAGTYAITVSNGAADRTYASTVSLTTLWARYTITIPGNTTGTWATDNTVGVRLVFDLGSGTSSQTASPNTWLAGNYLAATGSTQFVNQTAGATLNITGVQLEAGTVATPFEHRPIGTELALCQRYYQVSGNILLACQNSTTSAVTYYQDFIYPVVPRIAPTITLGTPSYSGASALAVNIAGASRCRLSVSINASTPMGTAEAQVLVSAEL